MKFYWRMTRPLSRARALVSHRRSSGNDLALATILAMIAGAANAGGFFALGQYTSHMTGYLSQLADNIAIFQWVAAALSVLAIMAFIAGAVFSTVLINWARANAKYQQYAWPLVIQGGLLVCFSWGGAFESNTARLWSLVCLCFIMGMQNATITKISGARIRTTHATGMVTDIGIELGRLVYGLAQSNSGVYADWKKLRILLRLVLAFLFGGVIGAVGYSKVGFFFSLPLGGILLAIAVPALDQARNR